MHVQGLLLHHTAMPQQRSTARTSSCYMHLCAGSYHLLEVSLLSAMRVLDPSSSLLLLHLAGTSAIHRELEQLVAQYIGQEDAITFGMGFATNAASIPAIAGPGSLVLSDALNHTSIVAGVKASGAKVGRMPCCT
jgi:hypothetical protein